MQKDFELTMKELIRKNTTILKEQSDRSRREYEEKLSEMQRQNEKFERELKSQEENLKNIEEDR
jgi:hypothetical protein